MPITLSSPLLRGPTPVDPHVLGGCVLPAASRTRDREALIGGGVGGSNLLVGTRFLLKPVLLLECIY